MNPPAPAPAPTTTNFDAYRQELLKKTFAPECEKKRRLGRTYFARVLDVHDGDTITVGIDDNISYTSEAFYQPITLHFRLSGIDAPELHPSNTAAHPTPHIELHRKAGYHVRDILNSILMGDNGGVIIVKFVEKEEYGRDMGYVFNYTSSPTAEHCSPANSINNWLIGQGLVKPYAGKKKEQFTETELTHILNYSLH
jgi:endonuclease YncB( thermonuclease family)